MAKPSAWPPPSLLPRNNPPARLVAAKPKERATFYSFHFADIFRVNHIRKAGMFKPQDRERLATPRDRSLWERAKNTNPRALAYMINRALAGTSVTVVLAGYETWQRPWVRYEIARSLLRGNGLLTVYLDGCECPREGFAPPGPNPLEHLALGWNHRLYETDGQGNWIPYDKVSDRISAWPKWLPRPGPRRVMPLAAGAPAYDWIADHGRQQLAHWTHHAAAAAGKL